MKTATLKLSEEEIVVLLKGRDMQGIGELYDQYARLIYGLIFRIVGQEDFAENILQDALLKVWKRIDLYDQTKGRFITWVLNIARNTAIDFVRSKDFQQQQKTLSAEVCLHSNNQYSHELKVDHLGLREVVAQLEPKYRAVIEIIYFQGYSHTEAAEALELPLGTLKSRIRKAFSTLRVALKE